MNMYDDFSATGLKSFTRLNANYIVFPLSGVDDNFSFELIDKFSTA